MPILKRLQSYPRYDRFPMKRSVTQRPIQRTMWRRRWMSGNLVAKVVVVKADQYSL